MNLNSDLDNMIKLSEKNYRQIDLKMRRLVAINYSLTRSTSNQMKAFSTKKILATRLVLSIFIAHLFAALGQSIGPFEIVLLKNYVYAMMFGTAVSLMVSYLLTEITRRLNIWLPWTNIMSMRLLAQLAIGVLFPFFLIFMLITVYYGIVGIWILKTAWLKYSAPYVILGLIIASLIIEILANPLLIYFPFLSKIEELIKPKTKRIKLYNGRPLEEMIYFYTKKRINYGMFSDGESHKLALTLIEILEQLPPNTYLMVRRDIIVKLSSIIKARPVGKYRKQVQIFLSGHEDIEIFTAKEITTELRAQLQPYIGLNKI